MPTETYHAAQTTAPPTVNISPARYLALLAGLFVALFAASLVATTALRGEEEVVAVEAAVEEPAARAELVFARCDRSTGLFETDWLIARPAGAEMAWSLQAVDLDGAPAEAPGVPWLPSPYDNVVTIPGVAAGEHVIEAELRWEDGSTVTVTGTAHVGALCPKK